MPETGRNYRELLEDSRQYYYTRFTSLLQVFSKNYYPVWIISITAYIMNILLKAGGTVTSLQPFCCLNYLLNKKKTSRQFARKSLFYVLLQLSYCVDSFFKAQINRPSNAQLKS